MNSLFEWLLEAGSFVEYRTRVNLLGQLETERAVVDARKGMIEDQKIQLLLQELKNWPGKVLSSHKSASQPYHKLSFLADIGLTKNNPDIQAIVEKIVGHQSAEGPFQLPTNVSKHFGGSGTDTWAWALCDAPVIVYALAKFGLRENWQVKKAADYLVNLASENGWRCVVSKELGKFRGPGRKGDPCPYATLAMLKMLAV